MLGARQMTLLALVLGLSAGVPVPAPAQSSGLAWQSTPASILKSALRDLVAAQDRYWAKRGAYARSVEQLQWRPEADVKVQLSNVTQHGWRAKATHRARPGRSCVVFVGQTSGLELPRTDGDGEMAGEERMPLCDRME